MYLESLMKLCILLLTFCNVAEVTINGIRNLDGLQQPLVLEASQRTKRFIFHRANLFSERNCECLSSMVTCKCCENVTLLLIKVQKKLCANFIYQRNGLNIDISLDSRNVKSRTVNIYRPMKICTPIPGSLFSLVCLNLLELNAFPGSLSLCPQFVIITKHQEWLINYTCQIIKTELPMVEAAQMGITMMSLVMTTRRPMSDMLVVSLAGNQSQQGNSIIPSSKMRPINLSTTVSSAMLTERPAIPTACPPVIPPARPTRMQGGKLPNAQSTTTPTVRNENAVEGNGMD